MGNVVSPGDASARLRFASELDRNFSVVASAGSGKTTAITQRVLSISRSSNAAEILPSLVVVTFANRAADEMQQRARQILLQEKLSPEVQAAFNRTFFGTIHSFCLKLLTDFGHYLGLPAPLELLSDDEELWREFVQNQTRIGHALNAKNRATLFRFVQARDLMELARSAGSAILTVRDLSPCPKLDLAELYTQSDQGGRDNIRNSQAELREWEKRYQEEWEFLRWPVCFTADNSNFAQLWRRKFSPLRKWINDAAVCVAAEVQRDFLDFRLERGFVTYPDQIALAQELLRHPIAGRRIREENFRVVLDEAQDTEPGQFSVLVEATRPRDAIGRWMETRSDPPGPGRFCMVGDFQQSIYFERADLKYYKAVHEALIADQNDESLEFSVTFRLNQKQLDFVNETFREILNEKDGQVRFVELQPRPEILAGKVIRVPLLKELLRERKKLKDYQKARIEADYLARWIKDAGLKRLSADLWRDVAVLCPRKAWLQTMAAALRRVALPVAIQSERDVKGDSPAYAWLTALVTIITDPLNAYQIVGVLREIFGVSDHDLAVFSEAQKARFRIDRVTAATGKISSHLRALSELREELRSLALFDAVSLIVTKTHLRERLQALPAAEFGDLRRELDALLAQAAEAEVNGLILAKFAQRLRDDFTAPRAVRFSADDNAIQLITSHKAKGSEWQAVILPFLARDLRPASPRYPHFVKSPETGELLIAFGKEDKSKDLKEAVDRARQQELERLLYVATTRARQTLVIVLDQEIFANNEAQLAKTAQLRRLLRGQHSYSGEFDRHSTTIDEVSELSGGVSPKIERTGVRIETLTARELGRATKHGSQFVQKLTPSALDPDVPNEEQRRSRLDNLATFYGRWWHKFFEQIDWRGGANSAEALFEKYLPSSPDQGAAAKHWNVTRESLFSDPNINQFLANEATQFHREYPFSWRRNERSVLEGFIDSLMIDREAGRCLLLDWKTNDVSPGEVEDLRARYQPQLAAYWKVVSDLTGLEVEAGLFSTTLGRLLLYQANELKTEWRRLEQLPPADLAQKIRPDAPFDV